MKKILQPLVRFMLGLRRPLQIGTYRTLFARRIRPENYLNRHVFFPGEIEIRASLFDQDSEQRRLYPSLGYARIRSTRVTANRRCAAVVQEGEFLLPSAADEGPWNILVGRPFTGGVIGQSGFKILVDTRLTGCIERGVFVGSWSPHNWFHWLVDTLPSVWLASLLPTDFDSFPLLLPKGALSKPAWREPLELIIGNRQIEELPEDGYLAVDDLVWIDSPSSPGPRPMLENQRNANFKLHGSAMNSFRATLLEKLNLDDSQIVPRRKVFLARKEGGNRPYNQAELIELAKDFGFEAYCLEDMSFRESVELMMGTSFLIGPHGAGWASALFCPPGITSIMWTWESGKRDNWFTNIAELRQMNMTVLLDFQIRGQSYWLDKNLLREAIEKSLQSS